MFQTQLALMPALTVLVPPCLFPGLCACSITVALRAEKEPSSCFQKPYVSSLPHHGSPSTHPLSTVTSCPSFYPLWGLSSCFCNVSKYPVNILFIRPGTTQFAPHLSQLLHLVIQCLNDSPPPKDKDTLRPTLGERHQALPAAEDCILPPELPLGQGLRCPQNS